MICTLHLSACVSSKQFFRLVEGSESESTSNYPTNVYKVKISETISAHLWLHDGFEEPANLTAVLNIPKETTANLVNNTIKIISGTHVQLLKIAEISTPSNLVVKFNETLTGNSYEQFTLFGYKSIPDGYLLKLENAKFEVLSNNFSIQFPDMNINGKTITPPIYKFVKDKRLHLITIN